MKWVSVFRKSLLEQLRAYWSLALTLAIAPCFVLIYWLMVSGGSTVYTVLVLDQDRGPHGRAAAQALTALTHQTGQPMLKVAAVADRAAGEAALKDRAAAALVILPPGFSDALAAGPGARVTLVGDLTNPQYAIAAVLASAALDEYVQAASGEARSVTWAEEPLGQSAARTEFEIYVPALLILAVVMLVFQAAMVVAREVEAGTLRRLQLTRMTAFDLLAGVTATQVLIGSVAVALTFLTAAALGFRSAGPLWLAVLIGALTTFSIVGVGLLVACFSRSVSEAFILANFPLIFLMFFTGAIYPMPPVPLFAVAGRTVNLFDILPPTHAVVALNKVLTLGAGPGDVAYELTAVVTLSAVYFAAGVWLFQRRRLREA